MFPCSSFRSPVLLGCCFLWWCLQAVQVKSRWIVASKNSPLPCSSCRSIRVTLLSRCSSGLPYLLTLLVTRVCMCVSVSHFSVLEYILEAGWKNIPAKVGWDSLQEYSKNMKKTRGVTNKESMKCNKVTRLFRQHYRLNPIMKIQPNIKTRPTITSPS